MSQGTVTTLPWEQLPQEPQEWYLKFLEYALPLGSDYNITRAYTIYKLDLEAHGISLEIMAPFVTWVLIADQWHWGERVITWAAEEKTVRTALWRKRRLELADQDWLMGQNIRRFATDALKRIQSFEVQSVGPNGEKQVRITIKPGEVAQMAKTAAELQRLAAGEPTALVGSAESSIQFYLPAIGGHNETCSSGNG